MGARVNPPCLIGFLNEDPALKESEIRQKCTVIKMEINFEDQT